MTSETRRAYVASARRIDVGSAEGRRLIPKKPQQWLSDAWDYVDLVPEVKYGISFVGNAMSRIRLYPGYVVEPDEAPVSLDELVDNPKVPDVDERLAEIADIELSRITNRRSGQAGLMRSWGVNLAVGGDSYLLSTDVPEDERLDVDDDEDWDVYSPLNLKRTDKGLSLVLDPPGQGQKAAPGIPVSDDALLYRIWRRHDRWPNQPDSNMRAVLEVCEELLIYSRQFRALGKSTIPAGILLVPSEIEFEPTLDGNQNVVQDGWSKFVHDVVEGLIEPVGDDSDPRTVAPHMIRASADYLDKIRHLTFGREIDERAVARVMHLIERLAHGMDLPPETFTGMGDINHWGAWQIEDSTYKAHIEPIAMIPADGLTFAVWRPALLEQGIDPAVVARCRVGIDPSSLVTRPNRAQDAKDAHNALAISWAALRKYLGFSEGDAPDEDELLQRLTWERSIGGLSLTRDLLNAIGVDVPTAREAADIETESGEPPAGNDDEQPAETDQPTPDEGEGEDERDSARRRLQALRHGGNGHEPVVAAAGLRDIGSRLSTLDQRLRDRLVVAASAALNDALRIAGNRLRTRAQGETGLAERVRNIAPERVGEVLGEETVASLVEIDDLLAGAFVTLASQWSTWVRATQEETLRLLGEEFEDDTARDAALAEMSTQQNDDSDAGWAVLLAALLGLARARVLDPDLVDVDGELDGLTSVPAGIVREGLARAGGALEPSGVPSITGAVVDMGASGGVSTGPRALRVLGAAGFHVVEWEWTVGAPTRPFLPHQALSGQRFRSWDDPALLSAGWPGHGHFFPGDHRGCQCDAIPFVVRVSEIATAVTARE